MRELTGVICFGVLQCTSDWSSREILKHLAIDTFGHVPANWLYWDSLIATWSEMDRLFVSARSAFTVHTNEKLLPVTQSHFHSVAQCLDPSQTNTAPTQPEKHKQGRRKRRRGLMLAVNGVALLSMHHKSWLQSRCNIRYRLGSKWLTAGCHVWVSMIRAKKQLRTRNLVKTPEGATNSGERGGSSICQEVRNIECDEPVRVSAQESQTACSSMSTSTLSGNPVNDHGEAREGSDAATATNQTTLGTKQPAPPPPSLWASKDVCWEATRSLIREFLVCFYAKYGSFIPLTKGDVLMHLKNKLKTDLTKWRLLISEEAREYKGVVVRLPVPSFRVLYNKHRLGLEDLSTLDHQNWLNDQVINMYGDLIVESAQHRVHFFNSFFHRQLMTKGYEGVKRWTRKVDLFSKSLLLVPIHLEIHWCLVTVNTTTKRIHLYDSQGLEFKEAAQNVLRYITTEAKEKKQTSFQCGWKIYFIESIPQQTNENDCGVFVLEYCRCLALGKPLLFSQRDIPRFRKRIYKELCECKLQD
ncbi:hypothetical protein DPEC_G00056020 [Dallia pectoralis]|uniref:Uncharacterized protein n=1 Tax=Dallia pectoralis TaxID=75939 RepID=A0ACC2H653_DALPE|nr:hypothetical protein DPEC_G00056020 [Dallia pectoralis]